MEFRHSFNSIVVCAVAALALGGCQTPSVPSAQSGPSAPGAAAAEATTTATRVLPLEPQPALTDTPLRHALDGVRQTLDLGQEELAVSRLDDLLARHPGNKAAQTLQRSMREDPVTLYGREFFVYTGSLATRWPESHRDS